MNSSKHRCFVSCSGKILKIGFFGKSKGFVIRFASMSAKQYVNVELKLDVAEVVGILTMSTSDQKETQSLERTPRKLYAMRGLRTKFRSDPRKPNHPLISTTSTNTDTIIKFSKSTDTLDLSNTNLEESVELDHFRRLSDICFQKKLTLPRKILLDAYFHKYYPTFSTDLDFYKLIKSSSSKEVNIILPCHICSELNIDANSYQKSVFLRKDRSYLWICSACYHLPKDTDQSKFSHASSVLDYDVYNYVKYFCSWSCTTSMSYSYIFAHEINCANQPKQKCPMNMCDFAGKLFEIEKHFNENHHSPQFISLRSTFITKLDRNEKLEFRWYVWTPPFFVLVKFQWYTVQWRVTTEMSETQSEVQPQVVLFDKDWKFLKTIKQGETRQCIDETEDVRIKCFIDCK